MTNLLVCIKRVPDTAGSITLTADGRDVDASGLGHTVSPHEECAVALAVRTAKETDGAASVLTLGAQDAVEQLRNALAVGCADATLIGTDASGHGPADVAAAIADVITERAASGASYDLVLLGTDAADTGDFQVGIRLAHVLDLPILTGIQDFTVEGDTVLARGPGPDGIEVFEVALPVVLAIQEGGIEPSYPSIPGRMKAKRAPVERVVPTREPVGNGRVRLKLPPEQPSAVRVLGEGPEAAPALVDVLGELGVIPR